MSNKLKQIKKDNEIKETNNFLDSLKANEQLKKVLFKAKNVSNTLLTDIVPQMARSINALMIEINSGNKTSLKDWNTVKFLKGHLYNLASYDRTVNKNGAFEMACTRSIKLAIMMYDYKEQFEVNEKNQVLVQSNVATPFIEQKLKGQKGATKKVRNESTDLVEVNTGTIDKVWSVKYAPTIITRSSKTKDTKTNFTQLTINYFSELEKVFNVANKKDYNKLLELVDEKAIEYMGNIYSILDSQTIRESYMSATENLSADGNVKISA